MHCRPEIVAAWSVEVPASGWLSDPFTGTSHSNHQLSPALSTASRIEDDIFVDPDEETVSTSSATSSRRSKSPVKRVIDLESLGVRFRSLSKAEALGPEGQTLFYDLSDLASGLGTIPKSLWDDSPEFRNELGRKPHESYFTYAGDICQDFATIQGIVEHSIRCNDELEPEGEWNNAVHGKLLAHVFDKKHGAVGFRSTISDRIDSQWLPKHPSGLRSSRMFDFCCYVRGDDATQVRLADTRRLWDPSVNSFNRPGLNGKIAPFLIETKTISRTEAEARDQLGTCILAQIERLKSMAKNSPTAQAVLKQMIFPLSYVNGARWTLMFARIDSADYSKIIIHVTALQSDTSNVAMACRTISMLRRLEVFLSSTFCGWWNEFLDNLA
ncbi:hypothetical protein J3458_013294 [Metarhizium acridum]|uniref:uncharacterized protein n=1 Tax=Metarhizium acridum TaxID=92637 RepID=UPI001C6BCF93|nr:hypothetical protein J3458_013294 [Metarhizium acridum]